ncbi:MAG: hypothetical protein ACLFVJ_06650 [Persicimonas sp.]
MAMIVLVGGAFACGESRLQRSYAGGAADTGGTADAGDTGDADSFGDWYEEQGEVIAPWVREIDLETAQAATLDPDYEWISWPLPDYDEMTEWQVNDVLWAPVDDPAHAFILRVLDIEITDDEIIFHTRTAGLHEVYIDSGEDDAGGNDGGS